MIFWTKRFFNVYIPGVGGAPINIGWGATLPKNSLIFEGKWRLKWFKSVIWKVRGNVSAPAQLDFSATMAKKGALPREEHAFF